VGVLEQHQAESQTPRRAALVIAQEGPQVLEPAAE